MKICFIKLITIRLLFAPVISASEVLVITYEGYGQVKVGMPISEAEMQLGTKQFSKKQYNDGPYKCDYYSLQDSSKGVVFRIQNGRVG